MYSHLHVKYALFLSYLHELEFLSTDFQKIRIRFLENPSIPHQVVPCGRKDRRTDTHDEANSWFSQFCESAQKTGTMIWLKRGRIEEMHAKCWSVHHKLVSCHGSGGYLPAYHRGVPGSKFGRSTCDLWRKKWHCNKFLSAKVFIFTSLSFHDCAHTHSFTYHRRYAIDSVKLHALKIAGNTGSTEE
jgi:hypothetical protein